MIILDILVAFYIVVILWQTRQIRKELEVLYKWIRESNKNDVALHNDLQQIKKEIKYK